MMRLLMIATALLAALAVNAQDSPAEKPDYSRDTVLRAFYVPPIELGPRPQPRVQFKFGRIEFRALGMDWRVWYLPMAPLSGTRMGVTQEMPDPFKLTGVSLPGAPAHELPVESRQLRAELKRIRRITQ
jgi:hypothetical protein